MRQLISEIQMASLNLVFPVSCQGCGIRLAYNNKNQLCQECIKKIHLNTPPFCLSCGRALNGPQDIRTICPFCINKSYHFQAAWQCCEYEGLAKELIHKFKYNNKTALKHILINTMLKFTKTHIDYKNIDAIIAVPMHTASTRARGFNQALLLSEGLSRALDMPLARRDLVKTKVTKRQVGLKRNERIRNMRGAFAIKDSKNILSKRLLIIDDVFTTGATIDECSKVLMQEGAKSVRSLCVARGKL